MRQQRKAAVSGQLSAKPHNVRLLAKRTKAHSTIRVIWNVCSKQRRHKITQNYTVAQGRWKVAGEQVEEHTKLTVQILTSDLCTTLQWLLWLQ